jgi:hypothetical protein
MRPTIPSAWTRGFRILASMAFAAGFAALAKDPSPRFSPLQPGVEYARDVHADVPWSIHVVRVDRTDTNLVFHSAHAGGRALGLATLSEIVGSADAALGIPVAALNGDFYRRDHAFAGDPRGLQISDGELLSAPSGGAGFWIDHEGTPHAGPLESGLVVKWPDGTTTPVGLNGERADDAAELYTPKAGRSTRAPDGREWILVAQGATARVSLPAGTNLTLVVREIRDGGNSPIPPGTLVLSVDSSLVGRLPKPGPGAVLTLSTATRPDLGGARTAIGGGPVLVHGGRPQPIVPVGGGYSSRSMTERHPRSAIGWDPRYFYLVEVDGRQPDLSVGMTLAELAAYLARLGCVEAMNLDGGGSATLWAGGEVRNSPCDGRERPIANALMVVRQPRR